MIRVSLVLSSIVGALFNCLPPEVVVTEFALENRRCLRKRRENRREGNEGIVQVARVVNACGLEGDLKAAIAHRLDHGVHVDEARMRFVRRFPGQVGVFVLKDRHANVDFAASAFVD